MKDHITDLVETHGTQNSQSKSLLMNHDQIKSKGEKTPFNSSILLFQFTALICPTNSVYKSCTSSCPPTCADHVGEACHEPCVEGCECEPGFLLEGTQCIPEEECGCYDDGIYYQVWVHINSNMSICYVSCCGKWEK